MVIIHPKEVIIHPKKVIFPSQRSDSISQKSDNSSQRSDFKVKKSNISAYCKVTNTEQIELIEEHRREIRNSTHPPLN